MFSLALLPVLHWINGAVWATVAARLSPDFLRVCTHPWRQAGRFLDPIWATFWGIAVNRLWLALHGSTFGETTSPAIALNLLVTWYIFAISLGCIVHGLRSWYAEAPSKGVTA